MRSWGRGWVIVAVAAACGDSRGAQVPADGDVVIDAVIDAVSDAPSLDAPPGYLVASPVMLDFGGVLVNRASPERVMTFTNTTFQASGPLALTLAGASPARFQIVSTTCTGVLAPAASCSAHVVFSPTAANAVTAKLALTDGIATVEGTVTGSGTFQAGLVISPGVHDFGYQPPIEPVTTTFTVSNAGNVATDPLALAITGLDSPDFTIDADTCTNVSLADMATCTVDVTFQGHTPGSRVAALGVTAGAVGPVEASLLGGCCAPPRFYLAPSFETFGTVDVGQTGTTHDLTLTNGWSHAIGPISVMLTGDFIKVADACDGQILAGHATCTISLAFRPTATGTRTGSISAYALSGSPGTSTLSGVGQ